MWSCKCTGSLEVWDNVVNAEGTTSDKHGGGLILYQYAATILIGVIFSNNMVFLMHF